MAEEDDCGGDCVQCMAVVGNDPDAIQALADRIRPAVWCGPMPESNGRQNWSVIVYRSGKSILFGDHYCVYRSEYPDRARFEADSLRYVLGLIDKRPDTLNYDGELHSGYVEPTQDNTSGDQTPQ